MNDLSTKGIIQVGESLVKLPCTFLRNPPPLKNRKSKKSHREPDGLQNPIGI